MNYKTSTLPGSTRIQCTPFFLSVPSFCTNCFGSKILSVQKFCLRLFALAYINLFKISQMLHMNIWHKMVIHFIPIVYTFYYNILKKLLLFHIPVSIILLHYSSIIQLLILTKIPYLNFFTPIEKYHLNPNFNNFKTHLIQTFQLLHSNKMFYLQLMVNKVLPS